MSRRKQPHPSLANGIEDGTPCEPMTPKAHSLHRIVGRKKRSNFYKWLYDTERRQRIRVQRRMWKLYEENRRLGGNVWKEIEAAYDDSPNAALCDPAHGDVGKPETL